MEIRFSIQADDRSIFQDLFDEHYVKDGHRFQINNNCEGIVTKVQTFRASEATIAIELVLFGKGVLAGVIANWLYSKLKKKRNTIILDEEIISINKKELVSKVTKIKIFK